MDPDRRSLHGLLDGLLDDAAWSPMSDPDPAAVLAEHRRLRTSYPGLVHSLMITDRDAAALDRAVAESSEEHDPLPVTMINTSGAGGLTSLAQRAFANLRIVAMDSPLRDPGDLVGNLHRVAAAARSLDAEIVVRVQIPPGFGADDAIAEAEAEGLQGHIDGRDVDQLADRLSTHIEADLSFAADLAPTGVTALNLICAIDALIDGAEPAEALPVLTEQDQDRAAQLVGAFDAPRVDRIRRRLTGLRCPNLATVLDQLSAI